MLETTEAAAVPLRDEHAREPTAKVLKDIWRLCIPSMVTTVLGLTNETVNALFIGHHGSKEAMAAVGIGNMLQNCCGLSIGVGLLSALDTLVSQAHGAGEDHLACIYMQRGRLISFAQMVWLLPLMFYCDRLLVAIGQDPEVARLAGEYNSISAPFLLCFFIASSARRLLSAFLRPRPGMIVSIIVCIFHVFWCWLFVAVLGLGNRGLGLANGASWTLRAVLMSAYLWRAAPEMGLQRRWVLGFQKEALHGWVPFMRIGLPALLQTCSEWWFWELCSLFVGYLGSEVLAAYVINDNFMTLVFMVPAALSGVTAALVGNALGAGRTALARQTLWCCVACTLGMWPVFGAVMVLGRHVIAKAYTRDLDVQRLVGTFLCFCAVYGFTDTTQTVMGGACRGIGRLNIATLIYILCFWALMLPLALLLAFPLGLGASGFFIAMIVGTSVAAGTFALFLGRADWKALAREASARIARDNASAPRSVRELARASDNKEDPRSERLGQDSGAAAGR